jgi:hypothetical protein
MEKNLSKSWKAQLINAIHYFHAQTGMKLTVIGRRSIKDPRMWERLHNGGNVTLEKADDVKAWLAAQGFHINPKGECYAEGTRNDRGEAGGCEEGIEVSEQKAEG